jgi:prephenate dehydratase
MVLKHETGALSRAISLLNLLDANLTKIESTPVVGRPFQYRFYLDFILEGSLEYEVILAALRPLTIELKTLGRYDANPLPTET